MESRAQAKGWKANRRYSTTTGSKLHWEGHLHHQENLPTHRIQSDTQQSRVGETHHLQYV